MINHNKLLGRVSSIEGLKTGFYKKCGYNIVATARKGSQADCRGAWEARGKKSAMRCRRKMKKYLPLYEMVPIVKKGETIDGKSF